MSGERQPIPDDRPPDCTCGRLTGTMTRDPAEAHGAKLFVGTIDPRCPHHGQLDPDAPLDP